MHRGLLNLSIREDNSLEFFDIVSGGAFKQATICNEHYTIHQLINYYAAFTVAIPRLEQLAKEGEEGKKIIAQYTRYGTVVLAFIQAIGLYFGISGAVVDKGVLSFITITLTFTAGTAFLMWLGEQITEYGIGNGISLIIFAGIVSQGPAGVSALRTIYVDQSATASALVAVLKIALILVVFIGVIAALLGITSRKKNSGAIMQKGLWEEKCMADKVPTFR
jgi:preprotein translocase subunit SecY